MVAVVFKAHETCEDEKRRSIGCLHQSNWKCLRNDRSLPCCLLMESSWPRCTRLSIHWMHTLVTSLGWPSGCTSWCYHRDNSHCALWNIGHRQLCLCNACHLDARSSCKVLLTSPTNSNTRHVTSVSQYHQAVVSIERQQFRRHSLSTLRR